MWTAAKAKISHTQIEEKSLLCCVSCESWLLSLAFSYILLKLFRCSDSDRGFLRLWGHKWGCCELTLARPLWCAFVSVRIVVRNEIFFRGWTWGSRPASSKHQSPSTNTSFFSSLILPYCDTIGDQRNPLGFMYHLMMGVFPSFFPCCLVHLASLLSTESRKKNGIAWNRRWWRPV